MEETMTMNKLPVENEKTNNANVWKSVIIGGVSGITLGAVAATSIHHTERGEMENVTLDGVNGPAHVDSTVPVAQVGDDMSFGEAFASAREQVGSGGVFVWHGQVYSTYTAEEWNNMTPAEHAEFGSHVNVVYAESTHSTQITTHPTATETYESESTAEPDIAVVEPEVEILGVKVVHTENGDMTLGGVTVDGEDYVLVDVDGGDFDIAWHDDNHDSQMQESELTDIRESHISVDDFAQAANTNFTDTGEVDYTDTSDMSILI